jgi:hypothetical protein
VRTIRWHFCFILLIGVAGGYGQVAPKPSGQQTGSYEPITRKQRFKWFVTSTVGPESLMAGLFSAGFSTSGNSPSEYGPHWDGFGKRYGMRLTGVSTGHAIEGTVGSLWGEDPRYVRAEGQPLKGRVKNIVVMTFLARRRDGNLAPAYARFIGSAGNNFLSNTWRADSQAGTGDACGRILVGVAGRMAGNAFSEFWPIVTKHVFHKDH